MLKSREMNGEFLTAFGKAHQPKPLDNTKKRGGGAQAARKLLFRGRKASLALYVLACGLRRAVEGCREWRTERNNIIAL